MSTASYGALASHYDALMSHVRYDEWADYIGGLFDCAQTPLETVLDLACGTGTLACCFARRGFTVIGVDASSEMLTGAAAKSADIESPPLFLQQQLWELDLYGTVDAAICTLDGLNYIIKPEQLQRTLERVFLFLNPGGVLVFDVRTPRYFEQASGVTQTGETPQCFCSWTPSLDLSTGLFVTHFNIFERKRGVDAKSNLWKRSRETHYQRSYPLPALQDYLEQVGFTEIRMFEAFGRNTPAPHENRVFFRALKPL